MNSPYFVAGGIPTFLDVQIDLVDLLVYLLDGSVLCVVGRSCVGGDQGFDVCNIGVE